MELTYGADRPPCENKRCKAEILPYLAEMAEIISGCENLHEAAAILLKIMREHMGVERGMLSLLDHRSGTITVHESLGLSQQEKARGIYNLGEGITGKVVESGQAIIVPDVSREPNFLNKTRGAGPGGERMSFLCVPIRQGKRIFGTISVEKPFEDGDCLNEDAALLGTIATLMAQAVEIYVYENDEKIRLEGENRRLHQALREKLRPAGIIGNSSQMREVYAMIRRIERNRVTVLVLGESGVGKERVANAIHEGSVYRDGPFVKFNCAALPESVIESELFGHERGAFTGADSMRKGRFEEADGGTIFLDEVGELSLAVQAKLLRVLQERSFERVGGNRSVTVNIRVVAATNRDLFSMVKRGGFREDLYYRLNVFPIVIPALRERAADIIPLADHFVEKYAAENEKAVRRISAPAIQMLMAYPWPGNVRELENVIERAVILCDDEEIHGYDLPPSLQGTSVAPGSEGPGLTEKLDAVEYEYIVESLRKSQGNVSEAAKSLGMTRRILGLRMEKHGIKSESYKQHGEGA